MRLEEFLPQLGNLPSRSWGRKSELVTLDFLEEVGDLQANSGLSGRG